MKYLIFFVLFVSCEFSNRDKKNTDPALPDQNSTLLGIDHDKDGVRDDVQSWIDSTYATQPNVKLAAKQYAKAYQNTFINKDIKEDSIAATKLLLKANQCFVLSLKATGLSIEESFLELEKLEQMHNNTKERILAGRKISKNFDGSSYKLKSKEEACNLSSHKIEIVPIDPKATL